MKQVSFLFFAGTMVFTCNVKAQTWADNAAAIIYNNCATCHHSGGIAPFSLTTYADAFANAADIKTDVEDGIMPPWPPDPSYRRLAHERLLSTADKNTLINWVNAGAPSGDLSMAPPEPTFPATGMLPGTPDLSVQIPTYTNTALTDDYRCFVLPSGTSADKYIASFEAIPGTPSMVHHVLIYADTTGRCAELDALDPGVGYTNFGGVGTDSAILIGVWVPGSSPTVFPNGFGVKLPAGADIVLQVHYPEGTDGMTDSTQVNFFFSTAPVVRDVFNIPILNHETNIIPPLYIPANTTATFTEVYPIPAIIPALSLIGLMPHMHLIGKNINAFGVSPANDTTKYISIPNWDFHWQGVYMMRNLVKIEPGTTLWSSAYYDNTAANPENPNSPPMDVSVGEATTDEMMVTFFALTFYMPGDESIAIDTTTPVSLAAGGLFYKPQELLEPYPVPAKNELIAKCWMDKATEGIYELVSMDGKVLFTQTINLSQGYSTHIINTESLPSGVYFLNLRTKQNNLSRQVSIMH